MVAGDGCNRKHIRHVIVVKRDTVRIVEETVRRWSRKQTFDKFVKET